MELNAVFRNISQPLLKKLRLLKKSRHDDPKKGPVEYQIERLDPVIRRWWPECGVAFTKSQRKLAIERADMMAKNLDCSVRVANRKRAVIHTAT